MSYLNDLRNAGFRVNWRTLLIGLEGPGKYPPLITLDEACAFADEQLAASTPPPEGAVAIAVASSEDPAEIRMILQKLAGEEKSEPARELRKWRLVLLKHAMAELPEDPLYGLLALTEFWERFDFPPDSPHIVQNRGNEIAPMDYFTEDNYRHLVQKHKDWISTETAALQG
jgi:Uncharacterized protein conserved in bacteria (DUF2247)